MRILMMVSIIILISNLDSSAEGPCLLACQTCIDNMSCSGELDCSSECQDCVSANCETVPIDGGLLWLILGGAGLGIRRIVKNKKNKAT